MTYRTRTFYTDKQKSEMWDRWQRGSNENTNQLLRQYFPRGIDMSTYSQAKLNAVAGQLNERPRITLQYKTRQRSLLSVLRRTIESAGTKRPFFAAKAKSTWRAVLISLP